MLSSLNEGTQRLSQATKAGETTLPSTSASGQTKIRQELQIMTKDFEDFRSHLVEAQSDLEVRDCTVLVHWGWGWGGLSLLGFVVVAAFLS